MKNTGSPGILCSDRWDRTVQHRSIPENRSGPNRPPDAPAAASDRELFMAKRKSSRTPLYELIKAGPSAVDAETPSAPSVEEVAPAVRPSRRLGPGQVLSVPVGYLLVAAAGVVLLLVVAYTTGYQRAGKLLRREYERQLLAQVEALANPEQRPRDPLVDSMWEEAGSDDGASSLAVPSGSIETEPGWGPLFSDPRRPNHRYFVLMETNHAGAERLATYCRDRGLETYVVVSHNNASRRLVIAVPGFETSIPTGDPRVQALRRRIHVIGSTWKQQGGTDLQDAYPLLFE